MDCIHACLTSFGWWPIAAIILAALPTVITGAMPHHSGTASPLLRLLLAVANRLSVASAKDSPDTWKLPLADKPPPTP